MPNAFVKSDYLKVFIADLIDAMPYLKASKSHFTASDIKGKKPGEVYNFGLRDSGSPTSGIAITAADRTTVDERKIWLAVRNKKSAVSLNTLESVVDIDQFDQEIGKTYGLNLGAEVQKDVLGISYFNANVAKVATSNGWSALAAAIAHQRAARTGSQLFGYLSPEAEANLSVHSLNNWHFENSDLVQKFYKEASIGTFHMTNFAYVTDTPVVSVPANGFGTVTVSAGADAVAPTASLSGAVDRTALTVSALTVAIPAGTPFTIAGAYACDSLGRPLLRTPFSFVVQEDAAVGATTLYVQKVIVGNTGARNLYHASWTGVGDIAGTLVCQLANSVDYEVAQIRTSDTMNWDNIDLDPVVGGENTSETFGGVKIQVAKYGNGDARANTTRWDCAYLAGIVDNRLASLAYIPV